MNSSVSFGRNRAGVWVCLTAVIAVVALTQTAAASAEPLIKIGGPARLPIHAIQRIPLICSAPCSVRFITTFHAGTRDMGIEWIGYPFLTPSVFPGGGRVIHLIGLSGLPLGALKDEFLNPTTHLRIKAFARNTDTGQRGKDQRSFRFKRLPKKHAG